MKFGVMLPSQHPMDQDSSLIFGYIFEQVGLIEKYDFDLVTLGEHHVVDDAVFEILTTLSALATVTKRVRLGTGVLLLPFHYPLRLAESVSCIDAISKGRVFLGVGMGYRLEEFDAFRIPFEERAVIFEEAFTLLRRLWTETSVTHHGKCFDFTNVSIKPKPVQKPHPPIWIGGATKLAIKRSARLGYTWVAPPRLTLLQLGKLYQIYKDELSKTAQESKRIEPIFPIMREASIAKNYDTARKAVETSLIRKYRKYVTWRRYAPERLGLPQSVDEVSFDDLEDRFIEKIDLYKKKLNVDCIIFRFQTSGVKQKAVLNFIKLCGEKVLPYFKKEKR
jgi:probable F420-dependent oxidoreductase